jgi:predicted transcriptional regulator
MAGGTITTVEKTTLYLPTELQQGLRALARRTGRPQAELIREAIAGYVGAQERPWPRSIGLGTSDGTVTSEASEAWIRQEWDRQVAVARKRRTR